MKLNEFCVICNGVTEGGSYRDIPLCLACYTNRVDDVLAHEKRIQAMKSKPALPTTFDVTVHTDGACSGNPGPGGWAAVLSTDAHKKEISGYKEHTTNNEMELVAVLEALKTLKRTGLSVAIYTDSQLVVGWLSGTYRVKEAHIAMLVRQINIMVQDKGLSLELFHVKAHSGNAGNERANLLAQLETAKAKAKKG